MCSYDEYSMLRLRLGRWSDPHADVPSNRRDDKKLDGHPRPIRFIETLRGRFLRRLSSVDP